MSRFQGALLISFLLISIDQVIKVYIKTSMIEGEAFPFLGMSWFRIYFVENEGMAFGWKLGGGDVGKLALSLFRTVAIVGIIWYIRQLVKRNAHKITTISVAFILAGALGNLIDSILYGVIFSDSRGRIAEFLPEGGGYSNYMYGNVVDMFSWSFFPPIFNFADACISVGVGLVILFRKKFVTEETTSKMPDRVLETNLEKITKTEED